MSAKLTITIMDEDGDDLEIPAAYVVCGRCSGKGSHVNPNIDGHGISSEEWERDWDDDSREMYLSGGYDVCCEECHGQRVTLEADWERMSVDEKKALEAHQEYQSQERAQRASELRWGY